MIDKKEFYTVPEECFSSDFQFLCFPLWVLINFQIPTKYTFCTLNSYTLCIITIYHAFTCKIYHHYNYIKQANYHYMYNYTCILWLFCKLNTVEFYIFFATYNGCYRAFQYEDSFTPILSHIIKLGSEHRDLFIC